MDYYSARSLLGDKDSRKLANNTYLQRMPYGFGIRLHDTVIVEFHPTFTALESDGWHTKTTKGRMNDYAPVSIGSISGGWSVTLVRDDLPCYCTSEASWKLSPGEGIVVTNPEDWREGGGTELQYQDRREGGKPVYSIEPCRWCNGSLIRTGADYSSGGTPYFDGIRFSRDGKRIMRNQPRKPKTYHPVTTESGWYR